MVFGYIKSSLPLVQAVLRGSLLHFCFDFCSASIAMLNFFTHVWRNVKRAFNSNIQRQFREIDARVFIAQTWRNRFAKMPKWVLSLFSRGNKRFCFLFWRESVKLIYRLYLCEVLCRNCLFILGITAITVTRTLHTTRWVWGHVT